MRRTVHELGGSHLLHRLTERSHPLRALWGPLCRLGNDSTMRNPCQQILVQRHRPCRSIPGTSSDGNFAHPIRCTVPLQGLQEPICFATRHKPGNQRRFADTRSLRSGHAMDHCHGLGMPRPQPSRPRKRASWATIIYILPAHRPLRYSAAPAANSPASILV